MLVSYCWYDRKLLLNGGDTLREYLCFHLRVSSAWQLYKIWSYTHLFSLFHTRLGTWCLFQTWKRKINITTNVHSFVCADPILSLRMQFRFPLSRRDLAWKSKLRCYLIRHPITLSFSSLSLPIRLVRLETSYAYTPVANMQHTDPYA